MTQKLIISKSVLKNRQIRTLPTFFGRVFFFSVMSQVNFVGAWNQVDQLVLPAFLAGAD